LKSWAQEAGRENGKKSASIFAKELSPGEKHLIEKIVLSVSYRGCLHLWVLWIGDVNYRFVHYSRYCGMAEYVSADDCEPVVTLAIV
jgi:hypothetical protein